MTRQHPLIEAPLMFEHRNYVGTCDWGHCNRETIAMRWDSNRLRYLAVCADHERGRGPVGPRAVRR
jgi:hypothetical protein